MFISNLRTLYAFAVFLYELIWAVYDLETSMGLMVDYVPLLVDCFVIYNALYAWWIICAAVIEQFFLFGAAQ